MAEIVAEVLELYQPTAAQSGVGFRVRMEAPLTVNGDPSLLAQAVRNLADNAINYAPPGSPTDILNFSASCLRNAVPLMGIDRYLKSGALVEIIPDLRRRALDVSLVVAHRRNLSRRVRAFMKWIEDVLTPYLE